MQKTKNQIHLIMGDLELAISQLKSLLATPVNKIDSAWGYKICTISRYVHTKVWTVLPRRQYVNDVIIPLLHKARKRLLWLFRKTEESTELRSLKVYAYNLELRIENLRKFVNSEPSAFALEDILAGTQEVHAVSEKAAPQIALPLPVRVSKRKTVHRKAKKARATARKRKGNLVFVSYSHSKRDIRWCRKLRTHLQPLVKAGSIHVWADDMISSGADWTNEILRGINKAKVGVLLVSPDYLASQFIMEEEFPRMLREKQKGRMILIWLHISASMYFKTQLREIQGVHNVKRPLDQLTAGKQNEVIVKACKEIDNAANS